MMYGSLDRQLDGKKLILPMFRLHALILIEVRELEHVTETSARYVSCDQVV